MKRTRLTTTAIIIVLIMGVISSCKKDDDDTTKTTGEETLIGTLTTQTLDASIKYTIDGFVIVPDGVTLSIPAGTILEGNPGEAENASALIVKQGGSLIATGTADDPIIFTAKGATANPLDVTEQGLWGGVILLGNAPTSNSSTKKIEGVPDEVNATYGGTTATDNSGTLTYVSIRHGGSNIGQDNEINGLTLGGVGSGTTIDYIEIIANKDDGIEFFGGVPNVKHSLCAYCGDDSYDYDEGFSGQGQFWVAIQTTGTGDRLAEQDGGTGSDEESTPYSMPTIYNATYIGNGGKTMIFRDNAGGTYANSIFSNTATGIRIEYRDDKNNSYDQLVNGNLMIKNCIFDNVDTTDSYYIFAKVETDANDQPIGTLPAEADSICRAHFSDMNNVSADLGLTKTAPIPSSGADAGVAPTGSWFDNVTYQGAFDPAGTNWASGWTLTFEQ